jgi:hypothetical protein
MPLFTRAAQTILALPRNACLWLHDDGTWCGQSVALGSAYCAAHQRRSRSSSRRLKELQEAGRNPPDLVERVPEVVPSYSSFP